MQRSEIQRNSYKEECAKITDAEWMPTRNNGRSSESYLLLFSLEVGDCKRIDHPDVACRRVTYKDGSMGLTCSLKGSIARYQKKTGKLFETYHEKPGVLVIRRVK